MITDGFAEGSIRSVWHGFVSHYTETKNVLTASLSSLGSALNNVMNGDIDAEKIMSDAAQSYWRNRLQPPKFIQHKNSLENSRFDAQLNRGDTQFGGWKKVPNHSGT